MTFSSLFGGRLKEARKAAGWSQAEAAEVAGVSREYWGRCERGASIPGGEALSALAQRGYDVLYVLTGERSGAHPAHDAAEQVLLDSYRRCNAQARQHLIQTAALLAAGMPPASSRGAGSSGGQSVVGDDAIQIGSVTGKARIKNR